MTSDKRKSTFRVRALKERLEHSQVKICCSSCARTSPSSLTAVHNSIACATILSINTKEYHPDPLNNLAFYMDLVTKNKDRLAYKEPKSLEHTARTTCLISLSTFFNKGRGYLVEKG